MDTALLVASLVHKPGTVVAHQFLRNAADQAWLISTWVETELASALAMQCRRGAISPAVRDEAWLRFQSLQDGRLQVLELTTADFDAAAVHHRVACQLLRISSG